MYEQGARGTYPIQSGCLDNSEFDSATVLEHYVLHTSKHSNTQIACVSIIIMAGVASAASALLLEPNGIVDLFVYRLQEHVLDFGLRPEFVGDDFFLSKN